MPKAWKRRAYSDCVLDTDSPAALAVRRQMLERFTKVAAPITYPELRAEQIRGGDVERKKWERQRDREFERAMRGGRAACLLQPVPRFGH